MSLSKGERFSVLAAMAAMTVSRPLLDILGQNAEFFIAHRSGPFDVIAAGVLLSVGVPLAFGLVGLVPRMLGQWAYWALAWALVTALFRMAYSPLGWSDVATTAAAAVLGAAIIFTIDRRPALRQVARYLLASPLLFLLLFLWQSPSGVLLRPGPTPVDPSEVATPLPLVVIVFDEFPASSLMDANGDVHSERYPNFGQLAQDGIWFSNAATVWDRTKHSVPAILTGVRPARHLAPFAGQYPNSLFTALSESHELAVFEGFTQLCPEVLCASRSPQGSGEARFASLALDITVLTGHTLLPDGLSARLPPIDRGWGHFGQEIALFNVPLRFQEVFANDPRAPFGEAVHRLSDGFQKGPPFVFIHALVPHQPWRLLPTGQRYPAHGSSTPGSTEGGWGDDSWLIAQATQRHLINVGYADFALGTIIDSLKALNLYEDAMIVVVADHGVSIGENVVDERHMSVGEGSQIGGVPLLVKIPGLEGGFVDRRRVLTIDIVPTIAEVMGLDLGWVVDGLSLLASDRVEAPTVVETMDEPVTYPADASGVLRAAAGLAEIFPDPDPFNLSPEGAPDRIGEAVEVGLLEQSDITYKLLHPEWYTSVDSQGDLVPAWVMAELQGPASPGDLFVVSMNGRAVAITQAFQEDGGPVTVQAMIDPAHFQDGPNPVTLALWDGERLKAVRPDF